jgi:hypothetical protein
MKDEDIVNWIDNYRKWRQWNRQHKRGQQLGIDLEEDLTSPFCSPLFSVVAFAKTSKVENPDSLREAFIQH